MTRVPGLRARLLACAVVSLLSVQSMAADELGEASKAPASAAASDVRRVWVLQDPTGYGSGDRKREITVYEVVCEDGKMTRVAEAFQAASAPAFGAAWVLRTQTSPDSKVNPEQLQRALSDVCSSV